MFKAFTKDEINEMEAFVKDKNIDIEVKTFLKHNKHLETFFVSFYDAQVKTATDQLLQCKEDFEYLEKKLADYFASLNEVASFKGPFPDGSKYKLQMLTPDDLEDYQLLKYSLSLKNKERIRKVYRVVPTSKRAAKSEEAQELLLHGTKAKNVMGILNIGFKPPEVKGKYGYGIYLTDDCRTALGYGKSVEKDGETHKMMKYLFVAKVKAGDPTLNRRKLERVVMSRNPETFEEYMNAEPTVLEIKMEFGFDPDSLLQKYYRRKGLARSNIDSEHNFIKRDIFYGTNYKIVLANHTLVTPVYLIQIEEKYNLDMFIKSHLTKFKSKNLSKFYSLKKKLKKIEFEIENQKSPVINEGFSERVKKAVRSALLIELSHIKSSHLQSVHATMQQLLFDTSLLFQPAKMSSFMHKTHLLKQSKEDYQYVLDSFIGSQLSSKVRHVFKICSFDRKKATQKRGKLFCFHGADSTKVLSILQRGFPKQQSSGESQCYASNNIFHEFFEGSSRCSVDGAAEKLSFVFVASSLEVVSEDEILDLNSLPKNCSLNEMKWQISTDFRSVDGLVPEYLVVFESIED